MDLLVESYRLAQRLPADERFALAQQIRRASVSVPANIAEGYGRLHRGDYLHHVSIARGSLMEVDTLLEAMERLGYATAFELQPARELTDHVGRMLTRLWLGLRR